MRASSRCYWRRRSTACHCLTSTTLRSSSRKHTSDRWMFSDSHLTHPLAYPNLLVSQTTQPHRLLHPPNSLLLISNLSFESIPSQLISHFAFILLYIFNLITSLTTHSFIHQYTIQLLSPTHSLKFNFIHHPSSIPPLMGCSTHRPPTLPADPPPTSQSGRVQVEAGVQH